MSKIYEYHFEDGTVMTKFGKLTGWRKQVEEREHGKIVKERSAKM